MGICVYYRLGFPMKWILKRICMWVILGEAFWEMSALRVCGKEDWAEGKVEISVVTREVSADCGHFSSWSWEFPSELPQIGALTYAEQIRQCLAFRSAQSLLPRKGRSERYQFISNTVSVESEFTGPTLNHRMALLFCKESLLYPLNIFLSS